uniref:D-aminoacyl-tRNA deacylase n=1 Tax=Oryza brachyantha TaxID=4533 RepID=J3KVD6_ORYBR
MVVLVVATTSDAASATPAAAFLAMPGWNPGPTIPDGVESFANGEITLEGTHHGPVTNTPTLFVEIGSTEEYWGRQDAADTVAMLLWKGLGLGEEESVGNWHGNGEKVLLGIGGGHYAPRHMDIVTKDGVWVGHLLSGYSLPMEEPKQMNGKNVADVGGMWKHSIRVSYEATKAAFPGGEIIAHIDQKSFKGWQKNAITNYLQELNIRLFDDVNEN